MGSILEVRDKGADGHRVVAEHGTAVVAVITAGRGPHSVRFRLLDPLRGIAAMWVFAFHFGFSAQLRAVAPALVQVFSVGHLGVPMFFVISGYCMMASVRESFREGEGVPSFLRRRALRIYPPFWCSLVVVAVLPFIIEGFSALKTGAFVAPRSSDSISYGFLSYGFADWIRVASLAQVFASLPAGAHHSLQSKFTAINAVYWTLASEFQFYLVMAVALALKSRGLIWLGIVTAVALPVAWTGSWSAVGIFLPYWPLFAVGIVVYLVLEKGMTLLRVAGEHGRWLSCGGLLVLCGGFFLLTLAGRSVGYLSFASGFGVALWLLHVFDEEYSQGLSHGHVMIRTSFRTLKYLGLMSYSLYLLHGRLQFLAVQIVRQLVPPGIVFDLAAIILTALGCYSFYLYCERPFIRTRSRSSAVDRLALVPATPSDLPTPGTVLAARTEA